MLNRPTTPWLPDVSPSRGWDCDGAPNLRLVLMWLTVCAGLSAIGVRLAQLQLVLQEDYASGFEQTYEVHEDIPSRQGRILAADGSILAGEDERYDLQINYRLIQVPADERWLKSEAVRHLDRESRKDSKIVEQEKQNVLRRREELWASIATLTGRDLDQLTQIRTIVQQRTMRMRDEVIRQRKSRQLSQTATSAPLKESAWQRAWDSARKELTEPPARLLDSEPLAEEIGFHTILPGVDADVKAEIEAHPERYPGLQIAVTYRRSYPQGELAAHLVGNRTPLTVEEVRQRMARPSETIDRPGDLVGRSGLELQYDSHLRGERGERRLRKNRRGEVVTSEVIREPRHGRDLVLTLDVEAQRQAERLLDRALATVTPAETIDDQSNQQATPTPTCPQGGCLIALDVHSGALLAAASAPRFDLSLLTHPNRERWEDLLADPRKPLFSRATQMALAPGSVFKIISAVAAVESGAVDPDQPFVCRGYLDRQDQHRCLIYRHHHVGHGDTRLADALGRSCNVYFFAAARKMGPQPLVEWSERFGIGVRTGIDLPGEVTGHLPSPQEEIRGHRRKWHTADTLGLAIGQADLLTTPLQMARAMAAVANGGSLVTPHLAGEFGQVATSHSTVRPVFSHPEPRAIPGLQSGTLAEIRQGLEMVVNHPAGTAYKSTRMKEIRIAGKTGTAETNGPDHAWFAGYAPAEQPRIAFVVVLEHGGSGGRAAGPLAKEFVQSLLEMGLVSPSTELVGDQ